MESLSRFTAAQADPVSGFAAALDEIMNGRKRGHWVWYVFPQLAGLGRSSMAQAFGIQGREEAEAYLRDGVLRDRLITITSAVARQLHGETTAIDRLMGSQIDSLKLISSLTLFGTVAREMFARDGTPPLLALANAADDVLAVAAAQGYPPCRYTLHALGR